MKHIKLRWKTSNINPVNLLHHFNIAIHSWHNLWKVKKCSLTSQSWTDWCSCWKLQGTNPEGDRKCSKSFRSLHSLFRPVLYSLHCSVCCSRHLLRSWTLCSVVCHRSFNWVNLRIMSFLHITETKKSSLGNTFNDDNILKKRLTLCFCNCEKQFISKLR